MRAFGDIIPTQQTIVDPDAFTDNNIIVDTTRHPSVSSDGDLGQLAPSPACNGNYNTVGRTSWAKNTVNPHGDDAATKLIAQIPHLIMELAGLRHQVDALESRVLSPGERKPAALLGKPPHNTTSGYLYPFDEYTQTVDRFEAESYGMGVPEESQIDSSSTWDESEGAGDLLGEKD